MAFELNGGSRYIKSTLSPRDAVAEGLEVAAVVERLRSRRVTVATGAGLDGKCMSILYVPKSVGDPQVS